MSVTSRLLASAGRQLLAARYKPTVIPCASKFWEPNRYAGYDLSPDPIPISEQVKRGSKMIIPELNKWKEEYKEKFRCDSVFDMHDGDYEIQWKFDNTAAVDEWLTTADSDHYEGKSTARFILSKNKTALFEGYLNTDPPKDGKTKYAGYAAIKSPLNFKSFKRKISYDWSRYNHLVVRCRGDGRAYQVLLHMDRYYDLNWLDNYNYALYTRGGPYWQVAKIPFSKFYLGHRGRIQDKQETVMTQLHKISHITVSVGDDCPGPFHLEIDYIALMYDESHKEDFAYEMYQVSPTVHD